MTNAVETRINKHEERRGVEARIQEDDPNDIKGKMSVKITSLIKTEAAP